MQKNVVGLWLPSPVKHTAPVGGVESTYIATDDLFRLPVGNEQYWQSRENKEIECDQYLLLLSTVDHAFQKTKCTFVRKQVLYWKGGTGTVQK